MAFHGSQEDGGMGGLFPDVNPSLFSLFTHHNIETTPTPTPIPKSHVFLMCHNRRNTKQG